MTNTQNALNAKRAASRNAKAAGLVAGIATYEDDSQLVHRENLVGQELDIASDGIHSDIETKNGPATLIYATRVSDGAAIKFWAGRPIENQLAHIDVDTIGDFLWTIVERHYTDKRGIAQLGYFLDYADSDTLAQNGNSAAVNRSRVAAEKSKPQASKTFAANDENEPDEPEELPSLTMGQFGQLSPAKQAAFMRLLAQGQARLVEAPATPLQKAAQNAIAQKKNAAPVKPNKTVTTGEILFFGQGEHSLGRGRRPSAVNEVLASGQNVYYNRRNGVFYADDKKTVVYSKPE